MSRSGLIIAFVAALFAFANGQAPTCESVDTAFRRSDTCWVWCNIPGCASTASCNSRPSITTCSVCGSASGSSYKIGAGGLCACNPGFGSYYVGTPRATTSGFPTTKPDCTKGRASTSCRCFACPANTVGAGGQIQLATCREVCEAGKGGPSCQTCPANTYSTGGTVSTPTPACQPCSYGTVAPPGSTSAAACVSCAPELRFAFTGLESEASADAVITFKGAGADATLNSGGDRTKVSGGWPWSRLDFVLAYTPPSQNPPNSGLLEARLTNAAGVVVLARRWQGANVDLSRLNSLALQLSNANRVTLSVSSSSFKYFSTEGVGSGRSLGVGVSVGGNGSGSASVSPFPPQGTTSQPSPPLTSGFALVGSLVASAAVNPPGAISLVISIKGSC